MSEDTKSAAGIHFDASGERVIGGSVRADGTVRRTVKVRQGFTPQEDVKRYNVREARQERSNHTGPRTSRFQGLNSALRNIEGSEKSRLVDGKGDDIASSLSKLTLGLGSKGSKVSKEHELSSKSQATTSSVPLSTSTSSSATSNGTATSSPRSGLKEETKPKEEIKTKEETKPKPKRYVPPKRKKYTLADLDKQ